MNFINNALCITALFAIGSISGRAMGPGAAAAARPAANAAPTRPAANAAPAPAVQVRSYKQIHDSILGMRQADVFAGTNLKPAFIQNISNQAKAAGLDTDGLKFLLQTARDKFAPFTGNDNQDLNILMQINGQIDAAAQNI